MYNFSILIIIFQNSILPRLYVDHTYDVLYDNLFTVSTRDPDDRIPYKIQWHVYVQYLKIIYYMYFILIMIGKT